jgi:uncharacterized protein
VDAACEECILKAQPADQLRLLDVQALDSELDRIRHRAGNLPEAQRLQQLQTDVRVLSGRITAAEVRVGDLRLEQRKADSDVELVRERAAKDQQLLDSGSIGDPKQLTSLQSEISSLARRQSELEDVELEVMERLEEAESDLANLLVQRDDLTAQVSEAESARDAALGDLSAAQATARAERQQLIDQIDAELVTFYEKLRADFSGVGAAALARGRCEGCRIELTPVDIGRIREAAEDEVLRCEECRRILVRTPESGL